MRVRYKFFATTLRGFFNGRYARDDAAEFATRIGPERLISISATTPSSFGMVTVWYWDDEEDVTAEPAIREKEERIQRLDGR